jgi:adenylosuccinate synthase
MATVIGLGFGDEGKGLTTSYLCSQYENPIVIRFNGGHQAGHTVKRGDMAHIFSSFGSGTLQGAPTYWSEFCIFEPMSFFEEYKALLSFGLSPVVFVHPLCMVTTPYDVISNIHHEKIHNHGSVGVGIGKTVQRHEDYYKLYVQDLRFESVVRMKLKNIAWYYYNKGVVVDDRTIEIFINYLVYIGDVINIVNTIPDGYHKIFEGAQGILLDQDFGFFPHVTRSNTTSKNAKAIAMDDEVYYITRTYQTRHGNGFMTNEHHGMPDLVNNEGETNTNEGFQGIFRKSFLDIELLKYALQCDSNFNSSGKNLVISCIDQTGEDFYVTDKSHSSPFKINIEDLPKMLGVFDKVLFSHSPYSDKIKA